MSKPGTPNSEDPADRRPEALTDEKHGAVKDKQLEGNRRPDDADLARGSEPATRAASTKR